MLDDKEMARILEKAAIDAIDNNHTQLAIQMLDETMVRAEFQKFNIDYLYVALKNRNAPIFRYILKIFYAAGEIELSFACKLFVKLKNNNDIFFLKIMRDTNVMDSFRNDILPTEIKEQIRRRKV